MIPAEEFTPFPKIARLSRDIVITEKIDGTNAVVYITEDGSIFAGSRTRWIHPDDDNFGFARWVQEHAAELSQLGPGRHFGEWWGQGIQRGYGLKEKRFSLFNTSRWGDTAARPSCCHVVPVIYRGLFDTSTILQSLIVLSVNGSIACPGFMKPEGVVIYHIAGNLYFKKTIMNDEAPKLAYRIDWR